MNWMLMMVMENPMQFTMVNEVPLDSSRAFWATRVENKGESAITTNPQKKRNAISATTEELKRRSGEAKQQRQERNNERVAIFLAPKCCDNTPLQTQANPPEAMIRKENKGILIFAEGYCALYMASITGTNAQKVYNSHIWPK